MEPRRIRILQLLEHEEGLTDREITDAIDGHSAIQQPVNQICRRLAEKETLIRRKRPDGLIGNFLSHNDDFHQKVLHKAPSGQDEEKEFPILRSSSLKIIRNMGFKKVGSWKIEDKQPSYELLYYSDETNVLYAFVENEVVKYIGKTRRKFSQRMYSYKNPGSSQSTNLRIIDVIKESLDKHSDIEIHAFINPIPFEIAGVPVDLAAGLEDNLIEIIDPEWNVLK